MPCLLVGLASPCSSPMLHLSSRSSMRFFSRSVVFLDVCSPSSHCSQYIRIHKSFVHYLHCSTCIPPLHCVLFLLCCWCRCLFWGYWLAALPSSETLVLLVRFSTTCFLSSHRHDHTAVHQYLLVPSVVACVSPIVSPFFPSPCEGLRIPSPRIYVIHPPPRFIVKFTHLSIVRSTLTPPSP